MKHNLLWLRESDSIIITISITFLQIEIIFTTDGQPFSTEKFFTPPLLKPGVFCEEVRGII